MLSIRTSGQPQPKPQRQRWLAAVLVSAAAHGSLLLWLSGYHRPVEAVSVRLSATISVLPPPERYLVELAQLPPADDQPSAPDPPVKSPARRRLAVPARTRAESSPPAPAPAGPISAQPSSVPGAPLDLTGDTLVAGAAQAQAGGATASRGAGSGAGRTPGGADLRSLSGARWPGPDRSRAISLEGQSWSCPWPREGDAEQIDQQTVVIRVVVRPDGSTESAEVLADPGHGFGQAAVACALRTRFTPARNPAGEEVRARSPPIRVRFMR